MIYIDINKTNPIYLTLSQNINRCADYVFEFVPVNGGDKIYVILDNLSTNVASYDLFNITDDTSAPIKTLYINEPTNLDNGQYKVNVYVLENFDGIEIKPENIIYLIYTTKGVVDIKEIIQNKYA